MKSTEAWWISLKVSEKERIASKVAKREVHYPECTDIWNGISPERREEIREHCTDSHGYILKDWFEGTPYHE